MHKVYPATALFALLMSSPSEGLQRFAPSPSPSPSLGAYPAPSSSAVSGTSFSVWAPNANSVSVVGTFNDWDGSVDKLRRHSDGVWRGFSTAARPGDEYMFRLDDRLDRRDPRAREVTSSGRCVVPSPLEAPSRLAHPSALADLIIYQMHIGTFHDPTPHDARPATLDDAIDKLDHLVDLGVNCVLLMPVNEFPFDRSWGYNPKDLFAVENAYGGPAALRRFVAESHRRGIAVHMDIVHNHYGSGDLDLWDFDTEGKDPPSPLSPPGIYFYRDKERGDTPWGPRPDFGKKEVGRFISEQVRMWFDEYGIDGLRWDSVVNIRAIENGSVPNPEGERLLDRVTRMIRREYPDKVNIAEDSPGDHRFDASWDYDFHHDLSGGVVENLLRHPSEVNIADIASRLESGLGFGRVVYSESHDEAGLLNSKTRLLSLADPISPLSHTARRTAALAATLVLTTPSIPMIFMGQELGQTGPFHDDLPLEWELCSARQGMFDLYRDLIHLRRGAGGSSASLQSPKIKVLLAEEEEKLLVYRRYMPSRPDSDIVVALNLGDLPTTHHLPFPAPGKWIPVFGTENPKYSVGGAAPPHEVEVPSNRRLEFSLPPRSGVIFARQPLVLPAPTAPAYSTGTPPPSPLEESSPQVHTPPEEPPIPQEPGPFVVANFTTPPWSDNRDDLKMSRVEENVWQIEIGLRSSAPVEMKIVDPSNGLHFGVQLSGQLATGNHPHTGTLCEGCPPIVLPGPLEGSYRLTFNSQTLRYRLEMRSQTSLDRVNILSSDNAWNRTSDPMHMVGDYLWQADLPTYPEDDLEFVLSANGELARQWGANTGEVPPSEWSGEAEPLGPPLKVRATTEGIRVLFDEREEKISVRPLDPSEIPAPAPAPPPRPAPAPNHLAPPEDKTVPST